MILNWQFISTCQKHHMLIVRQFLYSVFKIHLTCSFKQPYKEHTAWEKKKKEKWSVHFYSYTRSPKPISLLPLFSFIIYL